MPILPTVIIININSKVVPVSLGVGCSELRKVIPLCTSESVIWLASLGLTHSSGFSSELTHEFSVPSPLLSQIMIKQFVENTYLSKGDYECRLIAIFLQLLLCSFPSKWTEVTIAGIWSSSHLSYWDDTRDSSNKKELKLGLVLKDLRFFWNLKNGQPKCPPCPLPSKVSLISGFNSLLITVKKSSPLTFLGTI